ncbi:hypothetical protein HYT52_01170 [Candidatus Woesearchaeota archaeon]|nr:hypothetical protein [Candidatus Woesearchaeota archaeon]
MTSYHGLVLRVLMNPGRKPSLLERQVLLDTRATEAAGFQVPKKVQRTVLTYTPRDDIASKIRAISTDQELEALYQAGILSAESVIAGAKNAPPLHGISLRLFCYQFQRQAQRTCRTIIAHTLTDGNITTVLPSGTELGGMPFRTIDLLQRNSYKDWKSPEDIVKSSAKETYFVARLEAPDTTYQSEVRLRLELSNNGYQLTGQPFYDSGEDGFLSIFDPDIQETDVLDHTSLHDEQRLPALAALLASAEHMGSKLEIGPQGTLDSMSPNSRNRARYLIQVVHHDDYQFNVNIRMGDDINGKSFCALTQFQVNTEGRTVNTPPFPKP